MLAQNQIVRSTVAFTDTNARATGDYCGTSTVPQGFPVSALRECVGVVKAITILDYLTTSAVDLELWLFNDTFTAPADNAAWTVSDADALKCAGVIPLTASGNWKASAVNQVFTKTDLNVPIKPASGILYYALVARGTTPAWTTATPLVLSLLIEQKQ